MFRIVRPGLALVALLLSLLVGPAAAGEATAPLPTLTGATTSSFASTYDNNTFTCNDPSWADMGGTFKFTAAGLATGPYSGPFTETGSAAIAPDGTLTAFAARFAIDSPIGTVTSTKNLVAGTGACLIGLVVNAAALTTYQASITTPDGSSYTDAGTSQAFVYIGLPSTQTTGISEEFVSTQAATTPVTPATAEQCRPMTCAVRTTQVRRIAASFSELSRLYGHDRSNSVARKKWQGERHGNYDYWYGYEPDHFGRCGEHGSRPAGGAGGVLWGVRSGDLLRAIGESDLLRDFRRRGHSTTRRLRLSVSRWGRTAA